MPITLVPILLFLVVIFIAGSFLVVHALASLIGAARRKGGARPGSGGRHIKSLTWI